MPRVAPSPRHERLVAGRNLSSPPASFGQQADSRAGDALPRPRALFPEVLAKVLCELCVALLPRHADGDVARHVAPPRLVRELDGALAKPGVKIGNSREQCRDRCLRGHPYRMPQRPISKSSTATCASMLSLERRRTEASRAIVLR
jgi:hypothetical protein